MLNLFLRFLDLSFSFIGLLFFLPVFLLLLIIGLFDTGSPIFIQERVGRDKKPFILIKFRTMNIDTISVASHLTNTSSITKFGSFLRKTKLDELPQLWNVFKGDMSLVGPRPNLFNQVELIKERDSYGVYSVKPGITGLSQVNNIDMSMPKLLARTDREMIDTLTLKKYFQYIIMTVTGRGRGDAVK
ncbi:sugar transferase [Shewanella sp. 4_MG-2023]|uniref:sugar transferase n=1 Tax=Shewanella sp. 4_MG-2023 TaxID=3062652 RepID=UPI0026E2FBC1|nr:sugar transferase [Shewanella sp. 4_MG-2023]MDO6678453.1 sugar transferase [Shewanella sp. 4_MG-2023]